MFNVGDLLQRKKPLFDYEKSELWMISNIEEDENNVYTVLYTLYNIVRKYEIKFTHFTVKDSFKKVEDI